jgi:pyruvate formate lyase activating enzyme
MAQGIIFDIKRYAIHDGPGIRSTVFFKGCSLHCEWCHNPEGINPGPEIFYRQEKCPAECRLCLPVCSKKAIKKIKGSVLVNPDRCDFCAHCEKACVYEALEVVGKRKNDQEVMAEIEKDSVFFEESKGGVTFSGGEPLEQLDFLGALLDLAKQNGLHTTVDTCGHYPSDSLRRIWDKVDLFLYDLKMIDDGKHRKYTGHSNRLIHENLKLLAANDHPVVIRIPLVAGVNDEKRNIEMTVEFLQSLKTVERINLLPYHSGGLLKYKRLGKKNFLDSFQAPLQKKIEQINDLFLAGGFLVKIGG